MGMQVFLVRLNSWKPGKEELASKKAEEIINGEEANLVNCEFERDINRSKLDDLAVAIFMAKEVNVNDAFIIIDPNGLDDLTKELKSRISGDQKSNLLVL